MYEFGGSFTDSAGLQVSSDSSVGGLINVVTVEAVLHVVEALQPEVFYWATIIVNSKEC